MSCLAVVTTLANQAQARSMARSLVERGLVACAQISEIESFYTWDGALQNDKEFRVLLKTTKTKYEAVERAIREIHPDTLPAIHAFAMEKVAVAFAGWIESNCRGE